MPRSTCLLFFLALLVAQPRSGPELGRRDRSSACSSARSKCSRPATTSVPSTRTRPCSPRRQTRLDALSNLGAAYVHLGQFDEGIAQYQTALAIDPQNIQSALNLASGLLQVGTDQRGDRAAEAGGGVAGPAEERASCCSVTAICRPAVPADAVALLQPREALFGNDLAFAYVLGMALLQTDNERDGQRYIDRIFERRRLGRSASAASASLT